MNYSLEFVPAAKKEWDKLGHTIKQQFKNKLSERLQYPNVLKDAISGGNNLYKIKLSSVGYRLIYEVDDKSITVLILAIGKRNRNEVYRKLFARIE